MISFAKAFSDGSGEYAWKKFDETMSGDHIRFLLATFELIMVRIRKSEIDFESKLLLEKK